MDIAIITSDKDPASVNIRKQLLGMHDFREEDGHHAMESGGSKLSLYCFDSELVFLDEIDKVVSANIFIFASRHVSKAGVDAFTVHVPGNWGRADFGGVDRTLCTAPAALLKSAFAELQGNSLGMDAIQEATHHGPFIEKPCMFIEIGSSERMYKNEEAGKIVASAIVNAAKNSGRISKSIKSAVGIGGPHHCPDFKKIMLETDISVSHICPKYALESLDSEMLLQSMEKTEPRAGLVVLDWKGLGSFKEKVKKLIDESGKESTRT